jgi:hypothetical protein
MRSPVILPRLLTYSESIDEPAWYPLGDNHITRYWEGLTDPAALAQLPGECGEHELFERSPTGRMSPEEWAELVQAAREGFQWLPLVLIDMERGARIHEGNHRIRAALAAGVPVPVEVRVFAGLRAVPLPSFDGPQGRAWLSVESGAVEWYPAGRSPAVVRVGTAGAACWGYC